MQVTSIKKLYSDCSQMDGERVRVCGWVRTVRAGKAFAFMEISDGTFFKTAQIVMEAGLENYKEVTALNVGAAVYAEGAVVYTPENKQPFEIKADKMEIAAPSSPAYPLQKKRHTLEYLREIAHLRPRANTFQAVFRIRSVAAQGIHSFFAERGFVYVNTPIITGSDCEGAGEMFQVTTLDLDKLPKTPEGSVDFSKDFFGKSTKLTVSGQLEGELGAMALSKIYTFGPTFRAENSNTPRHLAEFWMNEPEMAFYEIEDNMDLAEDFLKHLTSYALENCMDDLRFLNDMYDKSLIDRLEHVQKMQFERITYTTAVDVLKASNAKFEYPVEWGVDLQSEHERFLVEHHYKKPVIITDYPKEIKSFYMKQNEDGKTVRGMDVLFPQIGEIIGGSQREENLDKLLNRIHELGMPEQAYWWYLDTRRFGTAPHSGFGLGFERLLLFITGMTNIRDVIPFPRYPQNAEF